MYAFTDKGIIATSDGKFHESTASIKGQVTVFNKDEIKENKNLKVKGLCKTGTLIDYIRNEPYMGPWNKNILKFFESRYEGTQEYMTIGLNILEMIDRTTINAPKEIIEDCDEADLAYCTLGEKTIDFIEGLNTGLSLQRFLKKQKLITNSIREEIPNLNEQSLLIGQVLTSTNDFFITGPAGVGKSYVLDILSKKIGGTYIIAPTGVAALNAGGSTIHRVLGIPPSVSNKYEMKPYISVLKQTCVDSIIKMRVLIIDEISMVSADMFELIEYILSKVRNNSDRFGGVRLLLFGDFLQLPPVPPSKGYYLNQRIRIEQADRCEQCFKSKLWKGILVRELTKGYRQKDSKLFNVLSQIRVGKVTNELDELFRHANITKGSERKNEYIDWTVLFATNKDRESYNKFRMSQTSGESRIYKLGIITKNSFERTSDSYGFVQAELHLKQNIRVMLIKNLNSGLVNGDTGTLLRFSGNGLPIVKFDRIENEVEVEEARWELKNSTLVQIPLVPAWGITINKSQGLTIEKLIVYMPGIRSPGQAYVALSRCRHIDNVKIVAYDRSCIFADRESISFYN